MLVNAIKGSLLEYRSYGLKDLDNANLMNRVDSKFIFPLSWLPAMLSQLKNNYHVLDIGGKRISTYKNRYFDTPPMKFYHDHHNGKLSRFKVRHRHYVDTDTNFLEVKRKTNQGRTLKTRILFNPENRLSGINNEFVKNSVGIELDDMCVSQHSGYNRIALANEDSAERLTIDFDLWYTTGSKEKIHLPNMCVAELKQTRKTKDSPFYSLKEKNKISSSSFSKYCIGCALLYEKRIKSNRFKPTLNTLKSVLASTPVGSNYNVNVLGEAC